MAEDFESALAWCLEALEDGRLSLQQRLDQFPQYREELQRLLPLAIASHDTPAARPSLRLQETHSNPWTLQSKVCV